MMTFNGELLEIFSRMPANYLYKLACVCKSSYELLSNAFFIKKHSKHMQLLGDTDFFVEPDCIQGSASKKLKLHELSSKASASLPQKTVQRLAETSRILVSCNGLLCCRNVTETKKAPLFLFNPTTGSELPIASPEIDESNKTRDFNIIFDCNNNEDSVEYLLMAIVSPEDWGADFRCRIYSPQEKVWKDGGKVDVGKRRILYEFSACLDGVVYMVSDTLTENATSHWPYFVAYDVKNSCSKFLQLPRGTRKGLESSIIRIFKWGNSNNSSICLVRLLKNVFTVWVLIMNNQHANTSSYSWNRVLKMRVKAMGLQHDSSDDDLKVAGFIVMNGSVLLFATQDKIYSYDLTIGKSNIAKLERVHDYGDMVSFTSFSSTLRPGGPGATTLSLS